jgi:peptidyl-prolyl cis-trans isomerase C
MKWLRDPLVLFLILGSGLAAIHAALRAEAPGTPADLRITVTDDDVRWLALGFNKTRGRAPTLQEIRSLVDRRVRDEMLYREAVALNLDQGDEALRRRLAMKIEYLAKDAVAAAEPSEEALQAHLDANAERYAVAPRRRFTQVYVNSDKRGAGAAEHAKALLARLRSERDLDPASVADVFMLEVVHPLARETDVERRFGKALARAIFGLDPGTWQGPLKSTYGLHLVRVEEVVPGRAPPLAAVRDRVRAAVVEARQTEVLEAYVARLRTKYEIELSTMLLDDEP